MSKELLAEKCSKKEIDALEEKLKHKMHQSMYYLEEWDSGNKTYNTKEGNYINELDNLFKDLKQEKEILDQKKTFSRSNRTI